MTEQLPSDGNATPSDNHTASKAGAVVGQAIGLFNEQAEPNKRIGNDKSTPLLSEGQVIDSLGFAFLIVTIEQLVLDELGIEIVLFDDSLMEMDFTSPDNPFSTIGALTSYLATKL
jgi:hypothetical protein